MIVVVFTCCITMSRQIHCYQVIGRGKNIAHTTPDTLVAAKTVNHQDHMLCLFVMPSFDIAESKISH